MAGRKRNPSGRGRLLGRLLLIIAGLVFGLNLYRWNASTLAGNTLPMPFGTGAAVVLSGSMEPALEANDLILVRESEPYRVGDMVVYQSGRELIVHRIVSLEGSHVITQGDANPVSDPPIDIRAVKGKVILRIPRLGAVINLLKKPAVGIALLAGAFALTERSFRAEKQKDTEDQDAIKEEIRRLKAELHSEEPGDLG